MESTIAGSENDKINMDSTIAGSENDNINMNSTIRVITKLPNSEQSYKGKVKTQNYRNRQNQSAT